MQPENTTHEDQVEDAARPKRLSTTSSATQIDEAEKSPTNAVQTASVFEEKLGSNSTPKGMLPEHSHGQAMTSTSSKAPVMDGPVALVPSSAEGQTTNSTTLDNASASALPDAVSNELNALGYQRRAPKVPPSAAARNPRKPEHHQIRTPMPSNSKPVTAPAAVAPPTGGSHVVAAVPKKAVNNNHGGGCCIIV